MDSLYCPLANDFHTFLAGVYRLSERKGGYGLSTQLERVPLVARFWDCPPYRSRAYFFAGLKVVLCGQCVGADRICEYD